MRVDKRRGERAEWSPREKNYKSEVELTQPAPRSIRQDNAICGSSFQTGRFNMIHVRTFCTIYFSVVRFLLDFSAFPPSTRPLSFNRFSAAVPFWGTNHSNFKQSVPKTGLRS